MPHSGAVFIPGEYVKIKQLNIKGLVVGIYERFGGEMLYDVQYASREYTGLSTKFFYDFELAKKEPT